MAVIAKLIPDVRKQAAAARKAGKRIGLVPTMGALHEGHISLIRRAREECTFVVVSIFVNPTQFGPKEDFRRYPRPLDADLEICGKEGVDVVFAPSADEMYPEGFRTHVEVAGLSDVMCGKERPGHFRAVATVVVKLFNIVQPDAAYFGQKDAQQMAIIRRMVADLNLPVKIRTLPTVRDADGLATSSRNAYLGPEERRRALVISQALKEAEAMLHNGCREPGKIKEKVRHKIRKMRGINLQYVAVVDPDTLEPLKKIGNNVLVALAATVGKTRLIDNVIVRNLGNGKRRKTTEGR